MEDKSNVSIFQGSTVEADAVHDFLAQQGIGSLIRNHMQETLDAGWVTATPDHAAEVFVAHEDENRTLDLLKNLFTGERDHAQAGLPQDEAGQNNAIIIAHDVSPEHDVRPDQRIDRTGNATGYNPDRPAISGQQNETPATERQSTPPPSPII